MFADGTFRGVLEVGQRGLGTTTGEVVPMQQHAQPARGHSNTGLLDQIDAQSSRGPEIEGQSQGSRRRLDGLPQRCQIGGIGLRGAAGNRRSRQRCHPTIPKRRQPAAHGAWRASTPTRNRGHRATHPCSLDHLQPLPLPRGEFTLAEQCFHGRLRLRLDYPGHIHPTFHRAASESAQSLTARASLPART